MTGIGGWEPDRREILLYHSFVTFSKRGTFKGKTGGNELPQSCGSPPEDMNNDNWRLNDE
jgi:hypothetical protein